MSKRPILNGVTGKVPFRGIIQRMALLRNEYKLATYIYGVQETPEALKYRDEGARADLAWKEYGEIKGIDKSDALYIGASAMEDGYVRGRASVDNPKVCTVILMPGKGSRLIERGIWGFPKGLFKAWLEVNHMLTNVIWIIIGAIVGGIAGNTGTILDIIHRHAPLL